MTSKIEGNQRRMQIKFKAWWMIGISIMALYFGVQMYYSNVDLQNQYDHLFNKMTTFQQIYGVNAMNGLRLGDYLLFAVSIITGVMSVVGFYWFDNKRLFQ